MPYRFSRERLDYSDFASGRVLRSVPGRTAFPVRLADELFQRCLALRPAAQQDRPVTLYDPCCGGGSLLCTVALLHWTALREMVGSDVDQDVLSLARRNLDLLTPDGLERRRQEIAALHDAHGKESHADALASVARLEARLSDLARDRPLPVRTFQADALDAGSLQAELALGSIDVVIADVPYGHRLKWLETDENPDDKDRESQAGPLWRLLEALRPALAADAVLAIVSDKAQRARHERYAPAGTLQIGKRRASFLRLAW